MLFYSSFVEITSNKQNKNFIQKYYSLSNFLDTVYIKNFFVFLIKWRTESFLRIFFFELFTSLGKERQ